MPRSLRRILEVLPILQVRRGRRPGQSQGTSHCRPALGCLYRGSCPYRWCRPVVSGRAAVIVRTQPRRPVQCVSQPPASQVTDAASAAPEPLLSRAANVGLLPSATGGKCGGQTSMTPKTTNPFRMALSERLPLAFPPPGGGPTALLCAREPSAYAIGLGRGGPCLRVTSGGVPRASPGGGGGGGGAPPPPPPPPRPPPP